MAFAINQNFDLKSKRKDFVRQELTLADLKTTRDADYPDDYTVTIGGKIYIFNSNNSVDATLGRWREFAGGGSITPGSGLQSTGGKVSIRIGSGFKFGDNNNLELDCEKDEETDTLHFASVKISTSNTLGFAIGSGLNENTLGKLEVKLGSCTVIKQVSSGQKVISNDAVIFTNYETLNLNIGHGLNVDANGNLCVDITEVGGNTSIKVGSGLRKNDEDAIMLGSCVVLKKFGTDIQTISDNAVIDKAAGIMKLKLATGLKVDDDGYLYIDMAELANV